MRTGGRKGSLDSHECAMDVVGFIRGRWVLVGALSGSRVHWGSLGSLAYVPDVMGIVWGSSEIAEFIGARPGVRRVHPGSLSSLWRALGVVGFIRCVWVHAGAPCGSSGLIGFTRVFPCGCRVPLQWLCSLRFALGVLELILGRWVYSDTPWLLSGSCGLFELAQVHSGGRRVHLVSLG